MAQGWGDNRSMETSPTTPGATTPHDIDREAQGAVISKGREVRPTSTTWDDGADTMEPLHNTGEAKAAMTTKVVDTMRHGDADDPQVDTSPMLTSETRHSGYNRNLRPQPDAGTGRVVMRESRNEKDSAGPVTER